DDHENAFMADVRWCPLERTDRDLAAIVGRYIRRRQKCRRHRSPVHRERQARGWIGMIRVDLHTGCQLRTAILDLHVRVIDPIGDGLLMCTTTVIGAPVPDRLTRPPVRLILILATASIVDVHVHRGWCTLVVVRQHGTSRLKETLLL